MKLSTNFSLRNSPRFSRTLVALLSMLMAVTPISVGVDCCGGGAVPECKGQTCQEKETLVNYTLWVGSGPGGSATIIGKYEDDGSQAFTKTVVYPGQNQNDCPSNMECGSFCAKDGRKIILKLYASGEVCPYNNLGAIFSATYGCSGSAGVRASDSWDIGTPFWETHSASCKNDGDMMTGVSNGCSSGQSCTPPPTGSGGAKNGSVHFEWEMGTRLGMPPRRTRFLDSNRMTKMLLNLNNLAEMQVDCTPEKLLTIPKDNYFHMLRIIAEGKFYLLPYYATPEQNVAPYTVRTAEFNEWQAENPTILNPQIDVRREIGGAPHDGDEIIGLPQCERVYVVDPGTGLPVLKQIRTGDALAVFEQLVGSFKIKFYYNGQFIVPPGHLPGNGPYGLNGTPNPKYTWLVNRPTATSIRVTEDPDNVATAQATTWTWVGGAWEMAEGDRIESKKIVEVLPDGSPGSVKTVEVFNADHSKTLSRHVSSFDANHRLIKSTYGEASDEVTTDYHYPADPLGQIEWMKRSDGYFERYLYVGDRTAPPYTTIVIRPWLDQTFDAATVGNARITETLKETVSGGTRVTVTEKIAGSVISKSVQSSSTQMPNPFSSSTLYGNGGEQMVQVTASQRFAREASGALVAGSVSTRVSFANGASFRLAGRLIKETNEEGIGISATYNTVSLSPQGDYFVDPAGSILKVVTERNVHNGFVSSGLPSTIGTDPIPGKSTREVSYEWANGTVPYEELWVCPMGSVDYVRVNRTFHTDDPSGRRTMTTVTSDNGTGSRVIYEAQYTGERLDWETDETGVKTSYANFDYDGNPQTVTREALTGLPALVTVRGTDAMTGATTETQQSAGGAVFATRSSLTDARGRTTSETVNGVTTTYGYGVGSETRTVPGVGPVVTSYFKDGQIKSVSGAGVVTTTYAHNIVNGLLHEEVTRGSGGATVGQIAERNGAGQTVREKVMAPSNGNVWRVLKYDPAGRLISEWLDGVQTRAIGYDAVGNRSETAFATPDPARTFGTSEAFVTEGSGVWREQLASDGARSREKLNPGAALSVVEQRAANGRTVTTTTTVNRADGTVTSTTVDSALGNALASAAVTVTRGGAVVSSTSPEKPGATTYDNDVLGRPVLVTDPATGAVTDLTYDDPATGQVVRNRVTADGVVTSTTNTYFAATETATGQIPGRLRERSVNGEATTYTYTPRGEVETVTGATYPLKYEYDAAGRLSKLHTYQVEPGTTLGEGNVTTWVYVAGTTLLQQKLDAAGAGPVYGYDGKGRLQTRSWARSVGGAALTTTYAYNLAGDLKLIDYSDNTPDVALGYDARGRVVSRTDAAGATTLGYAGETGPVVEEVGSDGSRLHREVDGVGRETGDYVWDRQRFATWGGWGYDGNTGRLNGALTEAGWVNDTETIAGNVTTRTVELTGTNVQTRTQRDGRGRVVALSTLVGAGGGSTPPPLAGRRYEYTPVGRVDKVKEGTITNGEATWTEAAHWKYKYEDGKQRGQVTEGEKKVPNITAGYSGLAGMKRGYSYDAIGNRKTLTVNSLTNDWDANGLNQITDRSVEGKQYVIGEANAAAALTVQAEDSQVYSSAGPSPKVTITRTPGNWFSAKIDTAVEAQAKNLKVTVTEQVGTSPGREAIGHVFVPGSREHFSYDADGNLTKDGRWEYAWDAENRLREMKTREDITYAGPDPLPIQRLTFSYDGLSRRIGKKVEGKVGAAWQTQSQLWYRYDGWNLIAEWVAEPVDAALARTYQWGTDLSGSRQGAGGVGGLLLITQHHSTLNIQHSTSLYPCYGDNGNIAALLNVSDPQAGVTVAAAYEYGPFGEPLRATGAMAKANPFRWSTKYCDEETGLCYYGYRYYSPGMGRWVSKDPIGEVGGSNLYSFVQNRPTEYVDTLGLSIPSDSIAKAKSDLKGLKLPDAIKFIAALGKLPTSGYDVVVDPKGKDSYSSTFGHFRKIILTSATPGINVVHEMVHAYNDINNTGMSDSQNEGMAFGFEGMFRGLQMLANLEKTVTKRTDCIEFRKTEKTQWKDFWSKEGTVGYWSVGYGIGGNTLRQTDQQDWKNIKDHLGTIYSCQKMAEALNNLLGGCCVSFTCSKDATTGNEETEIPAGRDIDEVFK